MKISNLKKINLIVNVADNKSRDLSNEPRSIPFIYGVASDGLTPFEIQLAGRFAGEELKINVLQSELTASFGHLFQPLRKVIGQEYMSRDLSLDVVITQVEDANEREIIKAIAGTIGGSCSGSCDCGCC